MYNNNYSLALLARAFASYQTRPSLSCCGLSEKLPVVMNSGLPPRAPEPGIICSWPGCWGMKGPCSPGMPPKSPPIGIGWSIGPPLINKGTC